MTGCMLLQHQHFGSGGTSGGAGDSLPHERSDDGRALRVRPVEQSVEEGQQAVSDEQSIASNVAH